MPPPGWFSQQGRPTIRLRCSESYIGSKCQSASFRLCVLTYRCLHGAAPSYLAKTIRPVSGLATRRQFRSADRSTLLVPTTRRSRRVTARFRRLQQEPGIRCLVMSGTCLPCSPSATNSRLYCLGYRTLSIDSFSTVSCKVVLQQ